MKPELEAIRGAAEPEENADEPCPGCDKVPAKGYWRCPVCDAEWPDDDDDDEPAPTPIQKQGE